MDKFILSNEYELNIVDKTAIIYSLDFKHIYQADKLETEIIVSFVRPQSLEDVMIKFAELEGFSLSDFNDFINSLIYNKIIVEYNG